MRRHKKHIKVNKASKKNENASVHFKIWGRNIVNSWTPPFCNNSVLLQDTSAASLEKNLFQIKDYNFHVDYF